MTKHYKKDNFRMRKLPWAARFERRSTGLRGGLAPVNSVQAGKPTVRTFDINFTEKKFLSYGLVQ